MKIGQTNNLLSVKPATSQIVLNARNDWCGTSKPKARIDKSQNTSFREQLIETTKRPRPDVKQSEPFFPNVQTRRTALKQPF